MQQTITTAVLIAGAVLAALMASLGMASAVHITSRRTHGYMHLIFYALMFAMAAASLLSGRDLSAMSSNVEEVSLGAVRHPLMRVIQPMVSLVILTLTGERIITHWLKRRTEVQTPPFMLMTFVIFWLGTVAAPALWGSHPKMSHDYAYPLAIGMAAVLATRFERELALKAVRNALLLVMVGSLLVIPLNPPLAMDASYSQGLLPGLPRLGGLAPHPVTLGMLAQVGLLCLLVCPFARVWVNRLAWALGLTVLVWAQSKTAWLAFMLCLLCIFTVRRGPAFWKRVGDPGQATFGIASVVGFMLAVAGLAVVLMFGELGDRLNSFFSTSEGAQLASFTGRDRIWAIAWEEWLRNPVFGYGPTLWDATFRTSIGMPNATHAHNQFMDTLSRSGLTGAAALVMYSSVLLVLSVRYTRVTGGLSLALFVALLLRAFSEVPLLLFGYGSEMIIHILLLIVLASAAQDQRQRSAQARGEPPQAHAPGRHERPPVKPAINTPKNARRRPASTSIT